MSELVRFEDTRGRALIVEVDDDSYGIERVARDDDGVAKAAHRLDDAMAEARPTIETIVRALRELAPDQHEVEFGIKLNAQAGVVVAKTTVEGHFTVKLSWSREQSSSS